MYKAALVLFLTCCLMTRQTYGQQVDGGKTCSTCFYSILESMANISNVTFITLNTIEIAKNKNNEKFVPIGGLISGAAGVALGIQGYSWKSELATSNVILGSLSIGLSTWNLIRQKSDKQTSWNINLVPVKGQERACTATLIRKF